jgi:hypothetical protein
MAAGVSERLWSTEGLVWLTDQHIAQEEAARKRLRLDRREIAGLFSQLQSETLPAGVLV